MTEEDKNLLIQDLCARLPYGVKVLTLFENKEVNGLLEAVYPEDDRIIISNLSRSCHYLKQDCGGFIIEENGCKPYLFPLSSMTEEQKKFFKDRPIFLDSENELVVKEDFFGNSRFTMLDDWVEVILWLVKNHFDYRGLIPKGLAIDATGLNIY